VLCKLSIPKRFLYLTYLSQNPAEKLYYFKRALNASIPESDKKRLSIYLLDRFLYSDLGFFRKTLTLIKNRYPGLYVDYRIKYCVLIGKHQKALEILSGLKGEKYDARKTAISAKFLKKAIPFNHKSVSFYTLLLNPQSVKSLAKVEEKTIKDPGIRLLYEEGRCDIIDFIHAPSPTVALAHHLCGSFTKAIREAACFKEQLEKYPFLLLVLFPAPPIFGDDLVSLSLARQESLFDQSAYPVQEQSASCR
jgi:soluble lytic murein transglycosylase